jgi:uroporphyrinogen decarboxylase
LITPKQAFINALTLGKPSGRVPHFELVFYLTMEAFGKVHPSHRYYSQWNQMEAKEQQLHRNDMADLYIATAEKYEHNAIFLHPNPGSVEETIRLVDLIREKTGDRYFLMIHGDATFSLPDGTHMQEFSYRMVDDRPGLLTEARQMVDSALSAAETYAKYSSLDGFALCADYCYNTGPFLSPRLFSELVTPFLAQLIAGYRSLGFYTIKHTDGNIMPILDQLIQANPHALHSLDPQGGVDIAEVKRLYGDQVCLIGNVNCGMLDTGTDEQVIDSVRYALQNGMPGGGYIFSTSNCIYTGMRLSRYELMLDIWRREGNCSSY